MIELVVGLAILLPSAGFLIWINTSSDAGYLMILGGVMALGAFVLVIIGTMLAFGGAWKVWPLPDPSAGRALGIVVGIPLAWKLLNWRRRRRPRRPRHAAGSEEPS